MVSCRVPLTSAQNFGTVALSLWLLIPVLFVVATVMTFMSLAAAADTGFYLHPHLPSSAPAGRLVTR